MSVWSWLIWAQFETLLSFFFITPEETHVTLLGLFLGEKSQKHMAIYIKYMKYMFKLKTENIFTQYFPRILLQEAQKKSNLKMHYGQKKCIQEKKEI